MKTVLYLSLVVIVTIVQYVEVEEQCAHEWKMFDHNCYTYEGYATWEGAVDLCAKKSARIISCKSEEKFDYIKNLTKSYNNGMDFWLNAKDDVTEGTWIWQDSMETVSFDKWHNGTDHKEPSGGRQSNCMMMSPGSGHTWWDKPCDIRRAVYCVRKTGKVVPTKTTTDQAQCGSYKTLFIICVIFLPLMMILMVCLVIYYYKQKIKRIRKARARWKKGKPRKQKPTEEEKTQDKPEEQQPLQENPDNQLATSQKAETVSNSSNPQKTEIVANNTAEQKTEDKTQDKLDNSKSTKSTPKQTVRPLSKRWEPSYMTRRLTNTFSKTKQTTSSTPQKTEIEKPHKKSAGSGTNKSDKSKASSHDSRSTSDSTKIRSVLNKYLGNKES